MKSILSTLALLASLTPLISASPAADAASQLQGRDPVICIGCINTVRCGEKSEPDGCENENNGADCTKFCQPISTFGCRCCNYENGELVGCDD